MIVPVYNVADYLDRCVESIIAQTYDDLEIILVDDGSLDNCPILCDEWAIQDKRIRVIHKSNGGLSDARNAGIEVATGDYLLFVDSDDYIESSMCEKLLTTAEDAQADIAVGNLYWEYNDHREIGVMIQQNGTVVTRSCILEEYFLRCSVAMVVAWNKLIRRELFFTKEQIRYPMGRLHEDEYTSYRLLYAANKTAFVTEPLYHYVQREGSIMSRYGERNLRDTAIFAQGYLSWADKYAPEKRLLMDYAALNVFWGLLDKCEHTPELVKYCSEVKGYGTALSRQVRNYWCNPYASKWDKLRYTALRFGIYESARRMYHLLRGH